MAQNAQHVRGLDIPLSDKRSSSLPSASLEPATNQLADRLIKAPTTYLGNKESPCRQTFKHLPPQAEMAVGMTVARRNVRCLVLILHFFHGCVFFDALNEL